VGKGERLYDTIVMPDGPFVYVLHGALTWLAGDTRDQAFRRLDVVIQVCGGGVMGALLVPRGAQRLGLQRAVWAVVAAAMWFARVMQTDFFQSVQREGYYVLFGSLAMCLVYASWEYCGGSASVSLPPS
jgi:hypothetical protein